jgi:cellulose synthase/poly-beta-1,6-N-acetylglucosamine synthase-like glycosyltransferase
MRATVFGSSLLQLLTGRRLTRHTPAAKTTLPGISLIVRIGNDDPRLPAVIANLDSLDYPDDKLDIVFIAQGPADHTGAIQRMTANPMRQVVVLRDPDGMNRAAVDNAVSWAKHKILVFSDAATLFPTDALKQLAGRLSNPAVETVECVEWPTLDHTEKGLQCKKIIAPRNVFQRPDVSKRSPEWLWALAWQ